VKALEKVGLSERVEQFVDIPGSNTSNVIEKDKIDTGHHLFILYGGSHG
jgi:hypothetical protein